MSLIRVEYTPTIPDTQRVEQLLRHAGAEASQPFSREFEIPEEVGEWDIGVVVGPSGSGKTSIGERLWGGGHMRVGDDWPTNQPVVEAIRPDGSFDAVTGALASVGLGDIPAWLRPFHLLSNGEQFRANLARVVAENPERVVIDEFSSVVDRQIACIGAMAFAKTWRRGTGQAVLLTPHYDILPYVDPDWVLDTGTGVLSWVKGQYKRPPIEVEIRETKWAYWKYFKPHHYLDKGPMAFSTAYVGFVDDEPVVHMGMSGHHIGNGRREARACRMVVMPEWQGAGISLKFMNYICERELRGEGYIGSPVTTQFHTAHPALCKVLRRDERWRQISYAMHGGDGRRTAKLLGVNRKSATFGGHWRVIQGYRFFGQRGVDAAAAKKLRVASEAKIGLDQAVQDGELLSKVM